MTVHPADGSLSSREAPRTDQSRPYQMTDGLDYNEYFSPDAVNLHPERSNTGSLSRIDLTTTATFSSAVPTAELMGTVGTIPHE